MTREPGSDRAADDERTGQTSRRTAARGFGINLLLLLASLALVAALSEAGLRLFCRQSLHLIQDERSLFYRYDSTLGWFPIANSTYLFGASRPITIRHNAEGFRGILPPPSRNPGILFLGDSFVWGYDVEAEERFTERLQTRHPEWNVYNLGVSGYGTDQEFLLLQMRFPAFRPRVVFLMYSTETDEEDNCSNARYQGYYKPYCTVAGNRLEIHGLPVPRGERVFLAEHAALARSSLVRLIARGWFKLTGPPVLHNPSPTTALLLNLRKYVESQGAVFLVGLTRTDPPLEDYLRRSQIPFIDLSTPLRYPDYGSHWTPAGHAFVADKIEEFLVRGNYLGLPPAR